MSAFAWILVAYFVIDRLTHVASVGRSLRVTPTSAVLALITGAGAIACVVQISRAA